MAMAMAEISSLLWFRKGLRLHDNPSLLRSCDGASLVYPVFVLDPWFLAPDPSSPSPGSSRVGINRIRFLLQSLTDLDENLRMRGSRLLFLEGDPTSVIPDLLKKWNINRLCFEFDTEPYAQMRDTNIKESAIALGVEVFCPISHTIFNPEQIIRKNGGAPPLTYQSFCKIIDDAPKPVKDGPSQIPTAKVFNGAKIISLPSLLDLGYTDLDQEDWSPFLGGEREALKRLDASLNDKKWVAEFEKPKGDPSAFIKPATTVLSPYLKFGCLSSRLFYARLKDVYAEVKSHSKPPVSLEGQLLWREFFYTAAFGTVNFDRMVGNPICKKIPWKDDASLTAAWRDGKTGYPWIDAAMIQLRKWGWMHHLARHSVACFLTRGDLFIHWEKGRDVFDRLLIDADWSINNGNWMWLSASAFFHQYHRIYSPITFGKKYDPEGKYIRHFLPVLKDMPKQYIYEPWTAPIEVQKKAGCIIGKNYPKPVVDHSVAHKKCREMMGAAYAMNKGATTQGEIRCSKDYIEETVEMNLLPSSSKSKKMEITSIHAKNLETSSSKSKKSRTTSVDIDHKRQRKITDY